MDLYLKNAYTEVNMILDLLGNEYKSRVPKQLLKLFQDNQNLEYHPNIDKNLQLDELKLLRETLVIISILNLKYWENDADKRETLKEIYRQNQIDYQKKMGLYNLKKIF